MKEIHVLVFLLLMGFLFIGCGKGSSNYLIKDARRQIGKTAVVVSVFQPEIAVFKEQITSGYGLANAAIDSAVNKKRTQKANERIQIVRQSMGQYNYPEILKKEMAHRFSNSPSMQVESVEFVDKDTADWQNERFAFYHTDAVLYIDVIYQFTQSFDALDVIAKVAMFPKTESLKSFREEPKNSNVDVRYWGNSIYRNDELRIRRAIVKDKLSKDERSEYWARNHGAATKKELQTAAMELADLIISDLQKSK